MKNWKAHRAALTSLAKWVGFGVLGLSALLAVVAAALSLERAIPGFFGWVCAVSLAVSAYGGIYVCALEKLEQADEGSYRED